jgi:hypothetical protein
VALVVAFVALYVADLQPAHVVAKPLTLGRLAALRKHNRLGGEQTVEPGLRLARSETAGAWTAEARVPVVAVNEGARVGVLEEVILELSGLGSLFKEISAIGVGSGGPPWGLSGGEAAVLELDFRFEGKDAFSTVLNSGAADLPELVEASLRWTWSGGGSRLTAWRRGQVQAGGPYAVILVTHPLSRAFSASVSARRCSGTPAWAMLLRFIREARSA